MVRRLMECFTKKKCKKQIKKNLELKKGSRGKTRNYILNRKDAIFFLITGQIKNTWYK